MMINESPLLDLVSLSLSFSSSPSLFLTNQTILGDATTTNRTAFPFFKNRVCYTVSEVLQRYDEITPFVKLSGPTNFAPVIYEAIDIVEACENVFFFF